MEKWQVCYIRENLTRLINATECNSALLASLHSQKMITEEEVQLLSMPTKTNLERATDLYRILKGRTGAFEGLKRALLQAKQSGAHLILEQCQAHDDIEESSIVRYGSISYNEDRVLGSGLNSILYRGTFQEKAAAAVKLISTKPSEIDKILTEVHLLMNLGEHENILKYFAVEKIKNDSYLLVAMELCDIDLGKFILQKKLLHFNPLDILKQATSGVAYLHLKNIIHGDLKPANILLLVVGHKPQVKICDLGLSKRVPDGQSRLSLGKSCAVGGGDGWLAPEILALFVNQSDGAQKPLRINAGYSADVFSLGCIFYFVITDGEHPFGNGLERNLNIFMGKCTLTESKIKTEIKVNHKAMLKIIKKMLSHDEQKRPLTSEVLASPVFEGQGTNPTGATLSTEKGVYLRIAASNLETSSFQRNNARKWRYAAKIVAWIELACIVPLIFLALLMKSFIKHGKNENVNLEDENIRVFQLFYWVVILISFFCLYAAWNLKQSTDVRMERSEALRLTRTHQIIFVLNLVCNIVEAIFAGYETSSRISSIINSTLCGCFIFIVHKYRAVLAAEIPELVSHCKA